MSKVKETLLLVLFLRLSFLVPDEAKGKVSFLSEDSPPLFLIRLTKYLVTFFPLLIHPLSLVVNKKECSHIKIVKGDVSDDTVLPLGLKEVEDNPMRHQSQSPHCVLFYVLVFSSGLLIPEASRTRGKLGQRMSNEG